MFSINRDPVVDEIIFEATKDAGDFDVIFDSTFRVDEIIHAVIAKVLDGLWRYLTIREVGASDV